MTDAESIERCRGAESSAHGDVDPDAELFEKRRNGTLFDDESVTMEETVVTIDFGPAINGLSLFELEDSYSPLPLSIENDSDER
jgi:hypothetical protein